MNQKLNDYIQYIQKQCEESKKSVKFWVKKSNYSEAQRYQTRAVLLESIATDLKDINKDI